MSINPYHPPSSNLIDTNTPYVPSLFWKLLFFILFPIECSIQYQQFTQSLPPELFMSSPDINQYFYLFISMTYFVGLFGLAFAFRIGQRFWWMLFLPIMVVVDVLQYRDFPSILNEPAAFIFMSSLFPITLLTWLSIYKYFRVFPTILRR